MTDHQTPKAPPDPEDLLEALSREECLQLVAAAGIGRIAVPTPQGSPLVVPVNYVLDGEIVVFRSDLGRKLFALRQNPVSFQVDAIDPFHRSGWSVLIQGIACEATALEVQHLTLEPWPGGEKQHWVRVLPGMISGRRIRLPEITVEARGYL
jgi:nitroimidazol reductase NimA-like FMN-containing flavoprotein (pyridoxamine 5'-phosphate oxidase superfamily)